MEELPKSKLADGIANWLSVLFGHEVDVDRDEGESYVWRIHLDWIDDPLILYHRTGGNGLWCLWDDGEFFGEYGLSDLPPHVLLMRWAELVVDRYGPFVKAVKNIWKHAEEIEGAIGRIEALDATHTPSLFKYDMGDLKDSLGAYSRLETYVIKYKIAKRAKKKLAKIADDVWMFSWFAGRRNEYFDPGWRFESHDWPIRHWPLYYEEG